MNKYTAVINYNKPVDGVGSESMLTDDNLPKLKEMVLSYYGKNIKDAGGAYVRIYEKKSNKKEGIENYVI